jgi:polyphosphate kinase 2 (PPK2 family)
MDDMRERKLWKPYMKAYEACLSATSTAASPWYIIPADDKPNARLILSKVILEELESLKMSSLQPGAERRRELQKIRKLLAKK